MTGMIKKLTAGALALIVTVGLMLLPGCSLPELAMNIDDVSYTSGEYLAALFLTYDRYYSENVYTYSMYGMDFWEQEWEYGEDDDAVKLSINEYIKQHTIDELIRQTAVKKMMEDEQVTLSEESLKNLEEIGKTVNDSSTLRFGFNRNSYLKMYELLRMNEVDLLFGLYDKGGKRAVSEDEILKYYEDNYYSYKLIERPLFDGDNADLGAEEKAEVLDKLNGYLDAFNETGKTTKDFDAIIDRAKADYEAEQEADDDHDHDHDDDDQDDDDTAAGTTAEPTTTTTAEP
ncbi:MAG: hypothetical protein FWE80_07580, partial [Oscillospiraceae bacterium]|nr:hypothetical protein [Oscillospiraceae bacterium]